MQIYDWEPGIGDPTFIGWFTVVAYLVAALLCWIDAMRTRVGDRRAYVFWLTFAAFMVALGINKQLDLQSLFTVVFKQFAKSTGWYEDRRVFQAIFIAVMAFFGLAFAALAWVWTSRTLPEHRVALLGGIFLVSFIVIRAASFHHIDQILGKELAFFRINHVLELGGIACVALGALKVRRRSLVDEAPRTARAPHNWKGSATGFPH
ncbi:MAG TPA: hypothetical protein VJ063_19075 [Verrucomicrobiae bacterium]|nr:hypothetical protein [Verrucomicrobiae bacterium]